MDEYWNSCEKRMKPGTLYHTMGTLAVDAAEIAAAAEKGQPENTNPLSYRESGLGH